MCSILYSLNFSLKHKEILCCSYENNKKFLILNFQSKNNEDNIEGYFCESIDYFINREGYVVFDFIKREQPHQSSI
ncbi:hypothetical protein PFMG_04321 [Plasmodium falciparum IGH-CR14]|uniref:Uncharacterized protein n=1 Tax=Plasmodium falciparum IGH-CR14 TaxID=580059 RepID=A0A0L1IEQ2_PLAFA|nr:hypothetical protein PFMG_04321 [Plasmodium falciparum IGH-CR14]